MKIHIKVLLSITTGELLCDFSELHEMLEKLYGTPIFSHQLPEVMKELVPWVAQHSEELNNIKVPSNIKDIYLDWVTEQEKKYKTWYEIPLFPLGITRGPLEDLKNKEVIIVNHD